MLAWPEEFTDVGRTIAEYVTVIGVLSYILLQLGGEVVNIGLISFLKQLVSPCLNYQSFIYFFIFLCFRPKEKLMNIPHSI